MNSTLASPFTDARARSRLLDLDGTIGSAINRGWTPPLGEMVGALVDNKRMPRGDQTNALLEFSRIAGGAPEEAKLVLPPSVLLGRRDLSAVSGAAGGATIQTDVAGVLPGLRPFSAAIALGATVISGLQSSASFPVTVGANGKLVWLPEAAAPPASIAPTFGTVLASPKRAAGFVVASKQLLRQSPAASQFVTQELLRAAGEAIDEAALIGTGASGEPTGIRNTVGVGTVTFGGAATLAKVLAFESQLASANVEGEIGLTAAPAVRTKWRAIERFAGGGVALWEGDRAAGMPAVATNHLNPGYVIAGRWSDCCVLLWGLELLVNPFTEAGDDQTRIVVNLLADIVVRSPSSFVISTDSGGQ